MEFNGGFAMLERAEFGTFTIREGLVVIESLRHDLADPTTSGYRLSNAI